MYMYGDDRNRRVRSALTAAPLALALTVFTPVLSSAQVTQPERQPEPTGTTGQVTVTQPTTAAPTGIVDQGVWTVTPMLGFGFGGNLENSPLALGVATAYNWTPRISLEGELGYARSATQGVLTPFDAGITTGSINALYHFAAENYAPYATVGLGFGHANTDFSPAEFGVDPASTVLMVNFGGGFKTRIADNLNLRTGVRYYNGNDLVPSFWRPYVGLTFMLGQN